jgi:hypothetical protein
MMNLSSLIIKKLVASLIGVYIGLTKLRLIDFSDPIMGIGELWGEIFVVSVIWWGFLSVPSILLSIYRIFREAWEEENEDG